MAVRRAGHEVRFTDIHIEHTGYEDSALRRRKTERNLRLLLLEVAEQPNDPFTLFNLGWTYHEIGEVAKQDRWIALDSAASQLGRHRG